MATETVQVYRCENTSCPLGSREDPGKFSSGMTAEFFFLTTGNPNGVEGEDWGEGICPNCGKPGVAVHEETHVEGTDPYEDLHQIIDARVQDKKDPLNAETSQEALMGLVEQREADKEVDPNA